MHRPKLFVLFFPGTDAIAAAFAAQSCEATGSA